MAYSIIQPVKRKPTAEAEAEGRTRPTIRQLPKPVVTFGREGEEEVGARLIELSDGTLLVSSPGFSVSRWRVNYEIGEMQRLQTLRGHSSEIISMVEMGNGLVASTDFEDVNIWSLGSGECLLRLTALQPRCLLVPKNSDNVLIVSGGAGGLMKSYTFDRQGRVESFETERVTSDNGPVSPDDELIIYVMVELQSGLVACCFWGHFRVLLWDRGAKSTVSTAICGLEYLTILELERDVIVTLDYLEVKVWDLAQEESRGKKGKCVHAFSLAKFKYGPLTSFNKVRFPVNNQYAIVTAFCNRILVGWNKAGCRLFWCDTFQGASLLVSLNNGLLMSAGGGVLEAWNMFEPIKW